MLTLACLMTFGAVLTTMGALMGRCPLAVPVVFLMLCEVIRCLPLR